MGERFVNSLPGKCGRQDVDDCMTALKMLKAQEYVSKNIRCWVFGGSHGGFLTGHLSGQFPDQFEAACALNAVFSFNAEFSSTDIPDWIFVEAGLGYDEKESLARPLTPDQVSILMQKSPIAHVCSVRAPMLIVIGGKDVRVPMPQSIEYYRILRVTLKSDTRLLYYPECCHALNDTLESQIDWFCNVLFWFYHYTRGKGKGRLSENIEKYGLPKAQPK